jgi:hypothetical protein
VPVHVSIHDVSPAFAPEVEAALAFCAAFGARPALLVVPDYHGRAPLSAAPAFAARLRELQGRGHEIFLHGYYHQAGVAEAREGGARPSRARRLFAQRVVSAGEAELADVGEHEAARRLDEGARVLREAGLRIDGFVPPAWSMAPWALPLLAERGYRYTEDHFHVYDPVAKRALPSLVLNFASRTPARMWSSIAWCRVALPGRAFFPARVAIHPGDVRVPRMRDEIRRLLAWAEDDLAPKATDLLA